jgi:hypothetical protein
LNNIFVVSVGWKIIICPPAVNDKNSRTHVCHAEHWPSSSKYYKYDALNNWQAHNMMWRKLFGYVIPESVKHEEPSRK